VCDNGHGVKLPESFANIALSRLNYWRIDMMRRFILQEEEDDAGGGGGGGYAPTSLTKEELGKLLSSLNGQARKYPIYAIFLATEADTAVVSFIETHRRELADISGKDCCFFYFRDLQRASLLLDWEYAEHAKLVYPTAKMVDIKPGQLPCLLFFRNIASGEYVRISLQNLTSNELLHLMRDIFDHIPAGVEEPFKAIRSYQRAEFWKKSVETVKDNVYEMGKDLAVDLVKRFSNMA
jgi:hypothetical protein